MMFMNQWEIESAVQRNRIDTIKGIAARVLLAHMEAVNACSDGWAYWKAPVVAATRLMELIQGPSTVSETTAAECLKLALRPLKSFYTKHKDTKDLVRPVLLDRAIIAARST